MRRFSFTFNKNRGFTLLEIVIALSLLTALATVLVNAFGPFLQFQSRNNTKERLLELQHAIEASYKAQAFSVDNSDLVSTDGNFPTMGNMIIDSPGAPLPDVQLRTTCPAKATAVGGPTLGDPADITAITTSGVSVLSNLQPLQKFATRSIQDIATDGFKNAICILVSRRQAINYDGIQLFYHTVAIVAAGENNMVEPTTQLNPLQPSGPGTPIVWTLQVDGDDQGVVVDGAKIAIANYELTKLRLKKFALAYETYYKTRYEGRDPKVPNVNYFYVNNGTNNGEPTTGSFTPPPNGLWPSETRSLLGNRWEPVSFDNVVNTGIWYVLGINDLDLYDAWGTPILIDNRSARVRGNIAEPPFTAMFSAFLPGYANCFNNGDDPNTPTNQCAPWITATAVGKM